MGFLGAFDLGKSNLGFGKRSGFLPTDFDSLYAWYDAELSGMTLEATSVTTLNDLGPNGYNIGNTGSNRPTLSASDSNFNDLPVLVFSGSNQYLFGAVDDIADHASIIIAAESTANDNSSALFHLGNSAIVTGAEIYFASASTMTASSKPSSTQQTISRTSVSFPDVAIFELAIDTTNSRMELLVNGQRHTKRSVSVWGNTINLLEMGRIPNTSYGLNGKVHSMVILAGSDAASVSGNKRRDVRNYLNDRLGMFTYKDDITFVGDSLTDPAQATADSQTGWTSTFQTSLGTTNYYYHNEAIIGRTADTLRQDGAKEWFSQWVNGHDTTSRAFVWCGVNDLVSGASAADVFADIETIVTDLIAAGYSEVYVGTIIPQGGAASSIETRRAALNDLIINWNDAEIPPNELRIVDFTANAEFDAAADSDNTTYYMADKTHLKTAGYAIIAADMEAAMGL